VLESVSVARVRNSRHWEDSWTKSVLITIDRTIEAFTQHCWLSYVGPVFAIFKTTYCTNMAEVYLPTPIDM
jgi:hypothetical protein